MSVIDVQFLYLVIVWQYPDIPYTVGHNLADEHTFESVFGRVVFVSKVQVSFAVYQFLLVHPEYTSQAGTYP